MLKKIIERAAALKAGKIIPERIICSDGAERRRQGRRPSREARKARGGGAPRALKNADKTPAQQDSRKSAATRKKASTKAKS